MKATIIIPFYNSEKYLPKLLPALLNQKKVNNDFEVILIDNASDDKSKKIIIDFIKENKINNFKYMYYAEKSGSYAARNFGIRNSSGDVLVFTDSDCIPESDWLFKIISKIRLGVIISGHIEMEIEDCNNIWEIFDSIAHLNNESNVSNNRIATANMAVMRSDFELVGFFSELYSGGDYEWSNRATEKGLKIQFVKEAIVKHPTRKSFSDVLSKSKRLAYGQGRKYKKNKKYLSCLVLVYFLKIFNFKTNIKYSKILKARGFKTISIIKFNLYFLKIRVSQFLSAIKGYLDMDPRELGIK